MKPQKLPLVAIFSIVAIGGMLATILVPVRSGDTPRNRARCQSRLKQVGLALRQYTRDHDDQFPPAYVPEGSTVGSTGGYAGSLSAYVEGASVFQCPSEPTGERESLVDYGYNESLPGRKSSELVRPVSTIALYELSVATPGLEAAGELTVGEALGRNRHLGGANYLFADGHVKWLAGTDPIGTSSDRPNGRNFTFAIR